MNGYELSRGFCDWAFENPHKIKPIHYAIYFFSIEHCNRLGWKRSFGLPSQMVMEAIGVKNWKTYSAGLNDLVDFGFIEMLERSKNQYSSNIIAIVNFTKAPTKAPTKALDKALQKHSTKQGQSIVSIDKQETKNNEQGVNVESFLDWFNAMHLKCRNIKGKWSVLNATDINNLKRLKEQNYTSQDWEFAFVSMVQSDWVIQNKTWTPSHYLRNENFQKYLNEYTPETFKAAWQ